EDVQAEASARPAHAHLDLATLAVLPGQRVVLSRVVDAAGLVAGRGQEVVQADPANVTGQVAGDRAGRGIGLDDAPALVGEDHGVARGLEEPAVPLVGGPEPREAPVEGDG